MPQEQVSYDSTDTFTEYRSLLTHVRLGCKSCENLRVLLPLLVEDSERRLGGVAHSANVRLLGLLLFLGWISARASAYVRILTAFRSVCALDHFNEFTNDSRKPNYGYINRTKDIIENGAGGASMIRQLHQGNSDDQATRV